MCADIAGIGGKMNQQTEFGFRQMQILVITGNQLLVQINPKMK